jgi:hypothetical protein
MSRVYHTFLYPASFVGDRTVSVRNDLNLRIRILNTISN